MKITKCDLCKREIEDVRDRFKAQILNHEDKPAIKEKEICAFCKEKLRKWLEDEKTTEKLT